LSYTLQIYRGSKFPFPIDFAGHRYNSATGTAQPVDKVYADMYRLLPRDATHSAVMRLHAGCGCPSVTLTYDFHTRWNTSKHGRSGAMGGGGSNHFLAGGPEI